MSRPAASTPDIYDYVIVGAGSAGCVVANRLSADPDVSVCLLEAGGSDDRVAIRTPMLLQQAMTTPAINWDFWTTHQEHLNARKLYWPRGKTLGGSTSINAMHYMRGAPANFDEWESLYGAEGWTWEAVLAAFKAVENNAEGGDALRGVGGPLHVQTIAPLNPLTETFLEAAGELQLARNLDFNGPSQDGVGVYQVTQKGPRRWSAADAFLRPALARDTLTVKTNAYTRRVILDGDRAVGVEAEIDGAHATVLARREVILCGGAINSPQLLMLSGVGDAAHLREVGVSPVVDLPGVGANLQDHLDVMSQIRTRSAQSIGYSWRRAPKLAGDVLQWMARGDGDFTVNPIQGGGFVRSSQVARSTPTGDLPDIQLVFVPALSAPHGRETKLGHGVTLHACQLYPKSRGHIRLASSDPADAPVIDPQYCSDPFDMEVMVDCYEITRRILEAPAFADERVEETLPGPSLRSREALADAVRANAETLYHPTSTCAMGTGDLAVLDARCRVRGVSGLRVVDASAMPRLIGGNTNAPTIMLATRASAMILEDAG